MLTAEQKRSMIQAAVKIAEAQAPILAKYHFEIASPTYLENWPNELRRLSIAQHDIPMTLEEAQTFIDLMGENKEGPGTKIALARLATELEPEIKQFPKGAFVRLGSRSPKDAFYLEPPVCHDAAKALTLLFCSESERVLDDLCLAVRHNYTPHIFVREWIDIPDWSEFRCFMKARRLIGVSQYYYRAHYPEVTSDVDGLLWAINHFFNTDFAAASHLEDVVFDVFVRRKERGRDVEWQVKLLEINPFFRYTDPCLFDWDKPEEFDGTLKFKPAMCT